MSMELRFAIQHHRLPQGDHYDLLLEQPAPAEAARPLAAWRLARLPADDAGEAIPAERIEDHREVYLHHCGPVRGGRGDVTPVETGRYELVAAQSDRWHVRLIGERLKGQFVLARRSEGWELRAAGPTTRGRLADGQKRSGSSSSPGPSSSSS